MDCDNQEIEATKTIGSTDIEKVLKKLKNKHTKESIILLDYIEKLEKELNKKYEVMPLYKDFSINSPMNIVQKHYNDTDIKIILNLISKLQADIEIKDKVIEKMGEYIKDYDVNVYTGEDNWKDTKQIKQYFYLLCIRKIKESRGRKMKTSELERKLKIKNEYLGLICDFGYDYDSCNTVESLKELIDELVDLAKKGLKNDDKSIMYMSADMKTNYNILHERIENNES